MPAELPREEALIQQAVMALQEETPEEMVVKAVVTMVVPVELAVPMMQALPAQHPAAVAAVVKKSVGAQTMPVVPELQVKSALPI